MAIGESFALVGMALKHLNTEFCLPNMPISTLDEKGQMSFILSTILMFKDRSDTVDLIANFCKP
jgi:hypothetical protein